MGVAKYLEIGKVNFLTNLAYMTELLVRAIFIGLIIFIFINLWKVIYASGRGVEGFTIAMMLWYFVLTEAIVTSEKGVMVEIGEDIQSGNIANYLNKPYSYPIYKYFASIGKALTNFIMIFFIGSLVVLAFIGPIKISLLSIPFIALSVFFAISMQALIMILLGLLAFWFEDARAMEFLYQKIVFIIGGMFFPLEMFPDWLAKISSMLPFSYIAYYPAKLFVKFSLYDFVKVAFIQLIWIVIFSALIGLVYRVCSKKVSFNGG